MEIETRLAFLRIAKSLADELWSEIERQEFADDPFIDDESKLRVLDLYIDILACHDEAKAKRTLMQLGNIVRNKLVYRNN